MPHYNLAFVGFGNVGQELARLLLRKRDELMANYNIHFAVTGIATGRHGQAVNPDGINLDEALEIMQAALEQKDNGRTHLSLNQLSSMQLSEGSSIIDFIRNCDADVLFENSPVNYETGQPALDHLKTALESGMHAITANKGPVVHGYRQLTSLAKAKGLKFYFESTVMDGAPLFSMFREALPGARLLSLKGILNSTTNLILTRMEGGETFEDAVRFAQSIGIAETDPSGDVDGWDASVKVAALVTVLMGIPLKPAEVQREGIRSITPEMIQSAAAQGKRWKLVCSAVCEGKGVTARVAPELVPDSSPLYSVNGTDSIVTFETDVLGALSISETDAGPNTTAYGLLADFINAVTG
jgi:homoserine dehydrogenase